MGCGASTEAANKGGVAPAPPVETAPAEPEKDNSPPPAEPETDNSPQPIRTFHSAPPLVPQRGKPLPVDLKPSYWDETGCTTLKKAMQYTIMLDAQWLVNLAERKGVLPRCQDVPEEAKVSVAQMERWKEEWSAGVLCISYRAHARLSHPAPTPALVSAAPCLPHLSHTSRPRC